MQGEPLYTPVATTVVWNFRFLMVTLISSISPYQYNTQQDYHNRAREG